MRYVIIGNSAAGVSALEAIREVDQAGEITIISKIGLNFLIGKSSA